MKVFVPGYDIGDIFYPDLPKDEQKKVLQSLTNLHPKACSFWSPTHQSFVGIETAFVFCTKDRAFPYPAQMAMVDGLEEAFGIKIRKVTLESGHFPFLSMPETTATKIIDLAS